MCETFQGFLLSACGLDGSDVSKGIVYSTDSHTNYLTR